MNEYEHENNPIYEAVKTIVMEDIDLHDERYNERDEIAERITAMLTDKQSYLYTKVKEQA